MKWSLLELNKYKESPLEFSEVIDVNNTITKREPGILSVEPVTVTGTISVSKGEYIATFTIDTVMTLASTRSLEPVPYPCNLNVVEFYMTAEQYADQKELLSDEDIVMILEKDLIDLSEAVEDHLILSIPLQVLTEAEKDTDATVKGNDWELMSEDAYYEQQLQQDNTNIDPRLAKLSTLLDNNKDSDGE